MSPCRPYAIFFGCLVIWVSGLALSKSAAPIADQALQIGWSISEQVSHAVAIAESPAQIREGLKPAEQVRDLPPWTTTNAVSSGIFRAFTSSCEREATQERPMPLIGIVALLI